MQNHDMKFDRDIIIIGGGPSGLSTALHLVKLDPLLAPRILILEKEHYPRHKLCAGGLVVDAEVILERLGLNVTEVPHVDVEKIHFDFKGKGLNIRVPGKHALRVIRRNEFDNWLANKAMERGVEIRQGVSVKNVIPDQGGVTIVTDSGELRSQIVVGADGSNGITRRSVLPNEPVQTARVLELLTPTYPQNVKRERHSTAYFDFYPVPDNIAGYVWDFPSQQNGEPMRCWGVYDTNILADEKRPALKTPLADEMKRQGYNLDDYEIKGHPIRWYSPKNTVSVSRVILVGDAIGADSIFGEGISMALGYGSVAAHEISESFRRGEFSFSGYRRRLARSGLGQTLYARWVLTYIIYPLKWTWFQFLLWRVLQPLVLLIAWTLVLNWSKRLK
jgi:flavin-dependent dehydrogenase